jgi:hypothetical protein
MSFLHFVEPSFSEAMLSQSAVNKGEQQTSETSIWANIQCDQIGQNFALWAISFASGGLFSAKNRQIPP